MCVCVCVCVCVYIFVCHITPIRVVSLFLVSVGEEDEVSIRDVAFMVAEAMEFKGEVEVHSHVWVHDYVCVRACVCVCLYVACD